MRVFADRQAAMDWIDKNQLGRRNLTDNQRDLIMHRVYERRILSQGGDRKSNRQNVDLKHKGRTSEVVGKEMGVTHRTVERAAEFGRAIDSLGKLGEQVKERIHKGEKVIKKDVIEAAKAKNDGDEDQAEKILSGQHKQASKWRNYRPLACVPAIDWSFSGTLLGSGSFSILGHPEAVH